MNGWTKLGHAFLVATMHQSMGDNVSTKLLPNSVWIAKILTTTAIVLQAPSEFSLQPLIVCHLIHVARLHEAKVHAQAIQGGWMFGLNRGQGAFFGPTGVTI